jgi:hypothetical protein
MDKLVNRVTVVQGSGKTRAAKTVYDARDDDFPTIPIDPIVRSVTVVEGGDTRVARTVHKSPQWAERKGGVQFDESLLRRFLKADMIRAQETYKQHLESATHDKSMWWLDLPANMVRAFLKADHQVRKSQRSQDLEVAVKDMQSDLRDLANDVQAAAYDAKADIKGRASETKAKVKGN